MHHLLKSIIDNKKEEIEHLKRKLHIDELKARSADSAKTRGFIESIKSSTTHHKVIAELKKISPGTGFERKDFDVAKISASYEEAGASALSVLTDQKFFGGAITNLNIAKSHVAIPILRKDFIIDPYQIYEARVFGADAILLMAINFVSKNEVEEIAGRAIEIGLDVLLETHDEKELNLITPMLAKEVAIGINNRNFKSDDLKVDLDTTRNLAPMITDARLLVSESGIKTVNEMIEFEKCGLDAFLIGSSFMKADDPGKALSEMLGS